MADGEIRDALADWLTRFGLSDLGVRRRFWRGVPREADAVHTSRAFPAFIETLRPLEGSVVLDLGPAVGANVEFLGQHLSCKVLIENLFTDVERHARDGIFDQFPEWLSHRFPMGDATVDGVLCWDLCDYLDAESVEALARQVARMLKPGGIALTMFATERLASPIYTKYVVVDAGHLQHRWHAAARLPREAWLVGQVLRLFGNLEPVGSHLLVHQQREVLFKKPL